MDILGYLVAVAVSLGVVLRWLWVKHAPSPAQTRAQEETSQIEATKKAPTTYRLRGIGGEITAKENISSLLREAWAIPESTNITTHSLAIDPARPENKIATVTFSEIPKFVQLGDRDWWKSPTNDLILDTHFYDFTPLHSDADSECFLDCIALSGLGGHAFGSFKSKGDSFMWLRDALPRDLRQTRIFIYGYDSKTADSESFQTVTDLGMKLQESISGIRPSGKSPFRPLILIGHSLGGLVLKEAIINMHGSPEDDDRMNFESLRAALFFGVPSLGMNIESLIPMAEGKPSEQLVKSLQATGGILRWQQESFSGFVRKFSRYWYYETNVSPTAEKVGSKWAMTGSPVILVNMHSATNGYSKPSKPDKHYVCPINRTHSEMVKFSHGDDGDYWKVRNHLNHIKDGVSKGKGRWRFSLTSSQSECVRSLAIENQESRQQNIDLEPGTCSWIHSQPTFQSWKESYTGILWIRGQPGSGKSSLMKHLVETLDCETSKDADLIVASFFFHGTASSDVQKSPYGFYSALLNQLLPDIPEHCGAIFKKHAQDQVMLGGKSRWEKQELRRSLSSIICNATSAGTPVIILADALDEAGQENAMEILEFFQKLEDAVASVKADVRPSLRILFSCRPYPILVGPDQQLIIDMDQCNADDLVLFIRRNLKSQSGARIKEDLARVRDDIVSKAGRTFQWASLMIKRVNIMLGQGRTLYYIQKQIAQTPQSLHKLYSQLVSSAAKEEDQDDEDFQREQALTLKLFQWLCFAKVPLTLGLVQHALVLGPGEPCIAEPSEHRDFQPYEEMAIAVTRLSRGLVEVRDQNSQEIVQFTHQSVADFLLLKDGLANLSNLGRLDDSERLGKVAGHGHFEISRACIQAMGMRGVKSFVRAHLPLRRIYQSGSVEIQGRPGCDAPKLQDCCYSFGLRGNLWTTDMRGNRTITEQTVDGISSWIVTPPNDCGAWTIETSRSLSQHTTQMIPVAIYGSEHLRHHLIEVEKSAMDQADLLKSLSEDNLLEIWRDIGTLASGYEWFPVEALSVTHLLATCGIASALHRALRDNPQSCSTTCALGRTPLHYAVGNHQERVVKLFTDHGAVDVPDDEGDTPLHHAADRRFTKMTKLLLRSRRIDVEGENDLGQTALTVAASSGRMNTIRVLLGFGAQIETTDTGGRTPIFYAARFGGLEVTKYLIEEASANVHVVDKDGKSLLSHAAGSGDGSVTMYILGIAPQSWDVPDSHGESPIVYAAERGDPGGAFNVLVNEYEAQLEEPCLITAMKKDQREIVERLLNPEVYEYPNRAALEQALEATQDLEVAWGSCVRKLIQAAIKTERMLEEKMLDSA